MECFKKFLSNICVSCPEEGRVGSIDYNIWLAQLTGVPLLGFKPESVGFKRFIIFYGFFMIFIIAVLYTICELYDLVLCLNDLDALTQNSCLTLSHVAGVLKAFNLHYSRFKLKHTVDKLKFTVQNYIITAEQRETFYRSELENKVLITIYATLVGITGSTATFLLFFSTQLIGESFPYRIKCPEWLPFSVQVFFMGVALPMTALQIVAIDYLNVNMINQIRCQLNCLNLSFNQLIFTDPQKFEPETASKTLYSIVMHHCYLFDLRNEIEDIFRMPILLQFFASLVIFGLTGFRATVNTEASKTDAVLYLYCGCLISQLFIYCWFGNAVFEQSKTLTDVGFQSSWIYFDAKLKKSLCIFLSYSQRPIIFTAGTFFALSLPSFTTILSKSYTFIALLRQVYGD